MEQFCCPECKVICKKNGDILMDFWGDPHSCLPLHHCWCEGLGDDQQDAVGVYAKTPQDAAKIYAKRSDAVDPFFVDGESAKVHVHDGINEQIFYVFAEVEVSYFAEEMKK